MGLLREAQQEQLGKQQIHLTADACILKEPEQK